MKMIISKWAMVAIIGSLFLIGTNGLYAKGVASDDLEKSVEKIVRAINYVDQRLLNEENVQRIEASENYEAIALLQRGLKERELIATQINGGQFEDAYRAFKGLSNSLIEAIRLSRSEERAAKAAKDRIDSARIISDAYLVRAQQRGIHEGGWGKEALALFKRAQEKRIGAQSLEAEKDYKSATTAFQSSTKLLQKAISFARKQGANKDVTKT